MPWAAPRYCSKAGHPAFTGARCLACSRAFNATRASASKRGYDADWRAFRIEYLRTYPNCCVAGCKAPATEIDHITPLRLGGARFDGANLRSMCKSHHSARTARDQTPGRGGGDKGVKAGAGDLGNRAPISRATSPKMGLPGKRRLP